MEFSRLLHGHHWGIVFNPFLQNWMYPTAWGLPGLPQQRPNKQIVFQACGTPPRTVPEVTPVLQSSGTKGTQDTSVAPSLQQHPTTKPKGRSRGEAIPPTAHVFPWNFLTESCQVAEAQL